MFGQGTRTPIAISILVKNPESVQHGSINFYDIGDYLNREQKLAIIAELGSIAAITEQKSWQTIVPDTFGDWLNQRDPNFDNYISIGDKKDKSSISVFENYSSGVKTNRDAWCYNSSFEKLTANMQGMISQYNQDIKKAILAHPNAINATIADELMTYDTTKISWNRSLKNDFIKLKKHCYDEASVYTALYRPYTKSALYFNRAFNDMIYQMPQIFPTRESENSVICLSLAGTKGFSAIITNTLPDLHLIGDAQCFPRYLYEAESSNTGLFSNQRSEAGYQRRDAINDKALKHFEEAYPQASIRNEDVFYYIYGLLHSEEYREKYADSLVKQLPRIPKVKTYEAFATFSKVGRELAALHLNYETVDLFTNGNLLANVKGLSITANGIIGGNDQDFYVTKMKFAKMKDPETGRNVDDKTKIIYNSNITVDGIPEEAYDYVVNGKPALEWVMERQAVTTDTKSGITNDANDWAIETMNNAKYPLELFLRIVNVSLQTQKNVRELPKLDILND